MLTPKGYTNRGQIQNYLLHGVKDYFVPQIDHWIAQMEKFIETETQRVFIADEVASVKKFDGNAEIELFIPECIEITEVKVISSDGTETIITSDYYYLYPVNEMPVSRIKIADDSGYSFTSGEQNIEITAKWGYSEECPSDISFATTVLVAGIINFSADMQNEVKSEAIGSYTVTYKDSNGWQDFKQAREIINNYRRIVV